MTNATLRMCMKGCVLQDEEYVQFQVGDKVNARTHSKPIHAHAFHTDAYTPKWTFHGLKRAAPCYNSPFVG